jgi:hypothetical protein
MKILWALLVVILSVGYTGSAHAVTCYTAPEAEAEQAVRIHSELMVIGLNCQHRTPAGEKNYYARYKEFSAKHGALFARYETALFAFYKRAGYDSPEGEVNRLRTRLANKVSGDAAKMRPDLFCQYYAPRIGKATAMTETQIKNWANTFFRAHPLTQPICSNAEVKMR